MKKLVALLLAVLMVAALFVGCQGNTPATDAPATDAPATDAPATDAPATDAPEPATDAPQADTSFRVAMITDYGDITDQSFNQTTYEAGKAFCEENGLDFTYYKPTGDSTAERVAMIEAAYDDGYNVFLLPGYAFAGAIVETAEEYSDCYFIALDVALGDLLAEAVGADYDYNPDNWNLADYVDLSNVFCAVYQEEIAGFFAGYAAVSLGYEHLAFLGGMAVPAVIRYGYGFVQGADAAATELGKADAITIEYCYGNQFFGDADITAYMDTLYANGVEVTFACGGGIFTSAGEAAQKVGAKVIGVDVDQAPTIDGMYGEGMTVTSAMKGLAATVKTALADLTINGKWADYAGQILNLGLVSENSDENYVGIPASTQWDDNFTEDSYNALIAGILDGSIVVSNDTSAMPATSITVNDLGNIK